MTLWRADQQEVQHIVETSMPEQKSQLKLRAENILLVISNAMRTRLLSKEEHFQFDFAVEVLMRLEAAEVGGGWWYRTKRRVQTARTYLGG